MRLLRRFAGILLIALGCALLTLGYFRSNANRREVQQAADAAPKSGHFVQAAGLRIFVQEAGPADGSPVLFVHGTGAWSETWRESMNTLAGAGFRAIAIDLPPFGYSQRPAQHNYSKVEQGRRILGVLDSLGIRRAILVGHSFGGGPTMEAALAAPQRVRALLLVDAALAIKASDDAKVESPALPGRAFLGFAALRDSVVATFLTNPSFTRRLLQGFIDNPARATDERVRIYQRPLDVIGSTPAISAWLPALLAPTESAASEQPASYTSLRTPLLLIWGSRDSITPLAQGQRIAQLAPQAQLHVIDAVGHIPQIEDPAAFNALLLKLLTPLK